MLSLSGGGSKGAYEVGAIYQMMQMLEAPENYWDVVSGVSVGAINAAGLSLFGKGEEIDAAEFLMDLWSNLDNSQVFKWWNPHNPVEGLTKEEGILDNSPLYELLLGKYYLYNDIKRHAYVNAVDSLTGTYLAFPLHDKTKTPEYRVSAVVGSTSIPFIFPPRNMTEHGLDAILFDGGTGWGNNMITAINDCKSRPGITSDS